jgi:hypothetical protein
MCTPLSGSPVKTGTSIGEQILHFTVTMGCIYFSRRRFILCNWYAFAYRYLDGELVLGIEAASLSSLTGAMIPEVIALRPPLSSLSTAVLQSIYNGLLRRSRCT